MIDTHCHLNFHTYDEDRLQVLERARAVGVRQIINPGIDLETSQAVIDLSEQHEGVYAAVGIHPNSSADFEPGMINRLSTLAQGYPVVAVGEIGLDYHWDKSPKAAQHRAFEAQLELARQLELPVIIHNREASDDVMRILEQWAVDLPPALRDRPGVLHSFSAPLSIAERALSTGFYLGFTGPVTYKNADELRSVAHMTPLDRLVVETDGPFLSPMPHRGKRNEPAYIPLIIDRIAGVKQITSTALADATTANAVRLFQLEG